MELGLLNYINVDLKWNVAKKGRRSVTRRPRKPGADSFKLGNNPAAFDAKKSGTDVLGGHFAEKVVDAPLKKRRLLRQSLSPTPQTPCLHGEQDLSPEPHTPSVNHEDSSQRCHSNSLSVSRKTKSKSGSRKSNILKQMKKEVSKLDDFSGIELLAAAACSSFLNDHVEDHSVLKEQITTPGVNSFTADMKESITSTAGSSNQDVMVPDTPILHDNGNQEEQKKVAPFKGLRLHWDLNTVMDEWEEPSNSLLVETNCSEGIYNGDLKGENLNLEAQLSGKHDAALLVLPVIEKSNGDSCGKTYESIEDLGSSQELMGTKNIASKISDGESSVSKSDVVDSLTHSDKCEDYSTSTTSVLREQTIVKCESDTIDNHLEHSNHKNTISKSDPLSECCGSDVTQDEQGHMAEGDTIDKVQVGYDSPFEDGELREPIEDGDYGTIENSLPEKIEANHEHGQAMGDQSLLLVKDAVHNNGIEQGVQVDTFERRPHSLFEESDCGSGKQISGRKNNADSESRPFRGNSLHIDESTSIDGCRNGAYIRRSRSSNIGDSYPRSARDLGPCVDSSMRFSDSKSSHEYHRPRNVNGDPVVRAGGGRSLDSHQFRNYDPRGYNRRPSPSERNNGYSISRGPTVRSVSRDRYRGGSGFHPPQQGLREDYHERKVGCFSPNFNRPARRSRSRSRSGSPIAWHFQKRRNLDTDDETRSQKPSNLDTPDDKRQPMTATMIRRNQRLESIGYPERSKPDDDFRFMERSGRFSQAMGPVREHKYKDNNGRKHDGYYEKVNGGGVRRFRYATGDSFESFQRRNLDRDSRSSGGKEAAAGAGGGGGGMVIGESKKV